MEDSVLENHAPNCTRSLAQVGALVEMLALGTLGASVHRDCPSCKKPREFPDKAAPDRGPLDTIAGPSLSVLQLLHEQALDAKPE